MAIQITEGKPGEGMSYSATAAAVSKVAKPKKAKTVSQAKPEEQAALPLPTPVGPEYGEIAVHLIQVRDQVRKEFDETALLDLAEDIAARGILQPLVVRRDNENYVLVAGERRLRAATRAGLASVPVMIANISEAEHKLAQLAENIQRENLTLNEQAQAIRIMYDELKSVRDVANKIHKSKPWVSKRLSLANGLGSYAAALLEDGITEDIELLQCVDKLDRATPGTNAAWALCEKIRAGKAGRDDAREALKRATEPKAEPTPVQPKRESTADAKALEIQPSHAFRYWLQHDHPWISRDYIEILTHKLAETDRESLMRQLEIIEEMQTNLERRKVALNDSLRTVCKSVAKHTGDLMQHTAFEMFYREKQEQQQ